MEGEVAYVYIHSSNSKASCDHDQANPQIQTNRQLLPPWLQLSKSQASQGI